MNAAASPKRSWLCVSSSIGREQLALLLGIISQCPFEAVGLVNRSVALASAFGGPGKLYHLEIQLHQAVISELADSGGKIELQRTVPLPGCGLLQLQERLVEIIAAAFIRQTRFDPRRKAETEQLLYDALPQTLRELQGSSESNLEVNGYRARIVRSELEAAGSRLFTSAPEAMGVLAPSDRIILDPLANLLPGLREHIPQTELLADDALPVIMEQHMGELVQRNETLNFITTLPCRGQAIAPTSQDPEAGEPAENPVAPPATKTREPAPTHLLQGATARPLDPSGTAIDSGLALRYEDSEWQLAGDNSAGVLVNGTPCNAGTRLASGDSITSSTGATFVLIEVKS